MKTVDELISSWSPEEREKLRGLIEECRQREKNNRACLEQSLSGIKRIADNLVGKVIEEHVGVNKWPRC